MRYIDRYHTDPAFRLAKLECARMRSNKHKERREFILSLTPDELLALVSGEDSDTRRI